MEKAKQSVAELQKTMSDAEVSAQQQETLDDVSRHIDRFHQDPAAHHQALRERLELAMVEFDAGHHSLVEAFRLAIYDLNNAGV